MLSEVEARARVVTAYGKVPDICLRKFRDDRGVCWDDCHRTKSVYAMIMHDYTGL